VLKSRVSPGHPCPFLPLSASLGDVLSRMTVKRQKHLRYARRRLERERRVRFRVHYKGNLLQLALNKMLKHREQAARTRDRWATFHPWTTEKRFSVFLSSLCSYSEQDCGVAVTELLGDDQQVAAALILFGGDHALYYTAGRDPAFARASVGSLNLLATIEWLGSERASTLDLGLGDESYKYAFGAVDEMRRDWTFCAVSP
jgi:CelD/BcsL family acetyltransferase involved in cellulose biosynthesis